MSAVAERPVAEKKGPMVRLRPGFGAHFELDGTERHPGVAFEDKTGNLCTRYPDKFELITGIANVNAARQEAHVCGEDISEQYPTHIQNLKDVLAGDMSVAIYKKGRRMRILIDGDIQDTDPNPIVNVKQLNKAVKNLREELERSNGISESGTMEEDDEE